MNYNKYNVTDGVNKARVHYSPHVLRSNNKRCITIYEKDYGTNLAKLFANVEDDTDIMTDYFDTPKVRILESDPEFAPLLAKLATWGVIKEDW